MKLTKTYLKRIIKEVIEGEAVGEKVLKVAKWGKPLVGKVSIDGKDKIITIAGEGRAYVFINPENPKEISIPYKIEYNRRNINLTIHPENIDGIQVEEDSDPSEKVKEDPFSINPTLVGFSIR